MRFVGFMNAYAEGLSGGDTWFIEVVKRAPDCVDITIVTSELGKKQCRSSGITGVEYIITTHEENIKSYYLLYLKRMYSAVQLNLELKDDDVLFASSFFLPDVIFFLATEGKKYSIYHMKTPNPVYDLKMGLGSDDFLGHLARRFTNWTMEKISIEVLKQTNANMYSLPTTAKHLKKYGFQRQNIDITNNGIRISDIHSAPAGDDVYTACWLGRAHPQKGVEDLIDIWQKVANEFPKAQLVIMGKGTERYRGKIEDRKLSNNITIKGFVSEREKYKTMKQCELFIFPSYYESFGIVILEAAACGLPVFAYDLPEYSVIYGDRIEKAPIGDKYTLADKIVAAVDPSCEYEGVAMEAEFIDQFSWDRIADNFWKEIMNE